MSYTNINGGYVVQPSQLSYLALTFSTNQVFYWATQFVDQANLVAANMDLTASGAGLRVFLPDATQTSVGQSFVLDNAGGVNSFGVYAFDQVTPIANMGVASSAYFVLTDNTTTNGAWRVVPFGGGSVAVTSVGITSANAAIVVSGSPITSSGTITLTPSATLAALTTLGAAAGTGFIAQTGVNTFADRTLSAGSNITISNPAGIAGNPSIALSSTLTGISSITTTTATIGPLSYPTADGSLGDSVTTNGSGTLRMATIPGRNRIVNGDFQVWARGNGGTAIISVAASTTQYTADRWQLATGVNQACTVTQTLYTGSGTYSAGVQRNNGQTGTGVIRFCTSLTRDMCIGAEGKVITLSFLAIHGANFSAAGNILNVTVYAGTGNTDVSGINGAFTGSTTPISGTAVLVAGATYTNYSFSSTALATNVTQLAVEFSFTPVGTAGVSDNFFVTDVQLEVSPAQTPYDRRTFYDELLSCSQFYQKSFNYSLAPAQNVGLNTSEFTFPATVAAANVNRSQTLIWKGAGMLKAPTVTFYSPAAASAQAYDETAAAACTVTTTYNLTQNGTGVLTTANGGTSVGNILGVHWQAEAEVT